VTTAATAPGPKASAPRDVKGGTPIDLILQRLVGVAVVALVGTVIGMIISITDLKADARTFMTRENGLELRRVMEVDWRARFDEFEDRHDEIMIQLAEIQTQLQIHMGVVGDDGAGHAP
jgi:hypothetical protein